MKAFSNLICIAWIAGSIACGGSKKSGAAPGDPPPLATPSCSAVTLSSNSCLNEKKLALVGIKDLDQLAAQMAAATVSCKPTPAEFKEFLCQFNQKNP